jgi:transcriptional regulator with XRE-family HTH domain
MRVSDFYKDAANVIKEHREHLGISQGELSRRTNLHRSAISKIESGKSHMLADSLLKIAIVLRIPLTELRFLARRELRAKGGGCE